MRYTLAVLCVAAVVGDVFSQHEHQEHQETPPIRAFATISGTGRVRGTVVFTQQGCGAPTLVEVSLNGLGSSQFYGFHVHETGDLSDGCTSLGGHYNPDLMNHGAPEDEIRHVGDLGNLNSNFSGFVEASFSDSIISLTGNRSIIGRGVVLHSTADDLGKTDHPDSLTTGNSGTRPGCGVIGLSMDDSFVLPDCSAGADTPYVAIWSLLLITLGIMGWCG